MSDNYSEINKENREENMENNQITPNNNEANMSVNENAASGTIGEQEQSYNQYNNVNYTAGDNNINQSEWTYNDYGPVGGQNKNKKPKKEKKPHEKGHGFRVLSVVLAVVLFVSIAGFSSYIIYDVRKDNSAGIVDQNKDGNGTVDINKTPSSGTSTSGKLENSAIYTKVQPSVVGIVTYVKKFGYSQDSQGSGVIYDADGYIVTNAHVVINSKTNKAYDKIEVLLSDGKTYEAKVLGADTQSDLAVIKISADNLVAAELGDSTQAKIGDKVFALGNPNGVAYAGSFSQGIISGLNREVYIESAGTSVNFMQVDAAINPGNSGGALVNEYGQVIGITSAKIVSEDFEGIGFAITMADAKPIIEALASKGYVSGRVMIGLTYTQVTETVSQLNKIPKGLRVVSINNEYDVGKRDVKVGDIIYKINNTETYNGETVKAALKGKSPGDEITLYIFRVNEDGSTKNITTTVKLGEQKVAQ